MRNSPARSGSRPDGFTLIEVVVTVAIIGIVMAALSAAVVVLFRSETGIVASTAEAQDTRQVASYLPLDIESGPSRADAYWATDGGDHTDSAGSGCDTIGSENVLRIDITNRRADQIEKRIAYRLVTTSSEARIDRYECSFDTSLAIPAWTEVDVINVADYLDPTASPIAESKIFVDNPLDPVGSQNVKSVQLRYVQRGDVETITAAPREEPSLGYSGLCEVNPLDAAQNMALFMERDVRLNNSVAKGTLYVGGTLSFSGSGEVAQASPPDPTSPVPVGVGLLAGSVDWAGSSGQLTIKNPYNVVIEDGLYTQSGSDLHGTSGGVIKVGASASASAGGSTPVITSGEAFATLRACSDRLAGLPTSCNNGQCAEDAKDGGRGPNSQTLDLAAPGKATSLNIDESKLAPLSTYQFKWAASERPSVSQPLIINIKSVVGGTVTFRPPDLQGQGTIAEYVIWNFPNADRVVLTGGTLWGTLMAPYADVESAADIEGGVIARSLTMNNATLHDVRYFQGTLSWS